MSAIAAVKATIADPVQRRRVVGEVLKFGVVGVGGVIVDVGLYNLFRHEGSGPVTSKAMSVAVAAVLSYFANRHWSFAHRARTGVKRELPLFILLSALALGLTEIPVVISYYGLHQHSVLAENLSANVVGLVLGTSFRFWSFKKWVFVRGVHDDEVLAAAAV